MLISTSISFNLNKKNIKLSIYVVNKTQMNFISLQLFEDTYIMTHFLYIANLIIENFLQINALKKERKQYFQSSLFDIHFDIFSTNLWIFNYSGNSIQQQEEIIAKELAWTPLVVIATEQA